MFAPEPSAKSSEEILSSKQPKKPRATILLLLCLWPSRLLVSFVLPSGLSNHRRHRLPDGRAEGIIIITINTDKEEEQRKKELRECREALLSDGYRVVCLVSLPLGLSSPWIISCPICVRCVGATKLSGNNLRRVAEDTDNSRGPVVYRQGMVDRRVKCEILGL